MPTYPLSRSFRFTIVMGTMCWLYCPAAQAQHLWWTPSRATNDRCVYGEITVLATHPGIYYCGCNWHPGEPAGGYCGIQDISTQERRTIFSVWDTSPTLHPKTTKVNPKTNSNRFRGEGEGAHTHMTWDWQVGGTFRFFIWKQPGTEPNTTDTQYFIHDDKQKEWRHCATITSPNGDARSKRSVATIGGGLNSFLENFTGRDRGVPKLALYRLWLGRDPHHLRCLTRATGDGTWGVLDNAYFLAEGGKTEVDALFARLKDRHGAAVYGGKRRKLAISDRSIAPTVLNGLHKLRGAKQTDSVPTSSRESK